MNMKNPESAVESINHGISGKSAAEKVVQKLIQRKIIVESHDHRTESVPIDFIFNSVFRRPYQLSSRFRRSFSSSFLIRI